MRAISQTPPSAAARPRSSPGGARYASLRDSEWGGDKRFDHWFAADLNNARLLPFGLYDQWVPRLSACISAAMAGLTFTSGLRH
ncbi:aminopeptidase [Halopseudomonas pachastrellae]|nr:aminopeptidase [Halopseudomonas pachastrellae]